MTAAQLTTADTLLRSTGGRSVLLRMPLPPTAGDNGEQVGLATPQFQDVELAPVTFRKALATAGTEGLASQLLVSASAVAALVGSLAYDSASVLFASAAGILIDGDLQQIEAAIPMQNAGVTYMYLLRLRSPQALIT